MKKITLSLLVLLSSVFFLTQSVFSQSCENFDTLTVGAGVVEQLGGYWILWDNTVIDAMVTDAQSNSPDNSFYVYSEDVDIVFQFGDDPLVSGQWLYSHYMYVPSGFSASFNIQTDPTPAVDWNMEFYFTPAEDHDYGWGEIKFNENTIKNFRFDMDTWFLVEIHYDLNASQTWVIIDGVYMITFANPHSIGGSDYWGWDGSYYSSGGRAYYDDVCFGPGSVYTGMEDPSIEDQISAQIYPNPTRDQVTIKSENIIDEARIYNNTGQLVYSGQFDNNQIIVNISHLQPSIYIVEVTVENRKIRQKLLVQR